MNKSLRIALVGYGRMGQAHGLAILGFPSVRIAIVVDPNSENLSFAREHFGESGTHYFSDLTDALEVEDIDGWIISSPTHTHVSAARILLERSQKILLEKPIALSRSSALRLADVVNPDSSNLMMGHILLWSPEFQDLRNRLEGRGPIREITALRQRSDSHRIDYPNESPFSLLMVHDLYCIQTLLSGKEPINFGGRTLVHAEGGENCAIARLTWEDSLAALAESNYFLPNESTTSPVDVISVKGSNWEESAMYDGDFDDALRNELLHFFAVLRGEAKVQFGARFQDALQVQGWVDALISSASNATTEGA